MLPEVLAGSYKRYKEDTSVFTTWLSKTAIACGYKTSSFVIRETTSSNVTVGQAPSSRLKGKARKEAKSASKENKNPSSGSDSNMPVAKYSITTQELLGQAEAVAEAKASGIQIPLSIMRVVERAIDARRRCASWFKKTGACDIDSTEGHLHFVSILEKALTLLRPLVTTNASSKSSTKDWKDIPIMTTDVPSEEIKNRFSVLDIEDPDDAMDLVASEVSVTNKPPSKTRTVDIYELEAQSDIDDAFIIFCFFEDLHRVQDFLRVTWEGYKTGRCDLTVASAITNLAFNLVRRAEDEIVSLDTGRYSKPHSYEPLSMVIFFAESFSKGEDPEAKLASNESLKLTPFDDFIYLPTYRTLRKFQQVHELGIGYPQPVTSLRMSYIFGPNF
ncbi:hypothetical protein MMC28_003973 [Mycoblastus sanguinarius]|nr:hypothetical protein [Mycoblastus sanguinarius]